MRRWLPLAVGLLVAVVCVRLGVWQVDRLTERRATNATRAGPLADTISVPGRFDFARDSVVANRALNGVPGVWILTPLVPTNGMEWIVLRGFTPSADGRAVDLAAVREPDSARVTGVFVEGVLRRVVLPPGASEGLYAVGPPVLTDGPHLSYAIQWFAFALIALIGGVILSFRDGRKERQHM